MTTTYGHLSAVASERVFYGIGSSVADLVGCVGGWMFDLAMAGWRVTAVVPDIGDIRPLQILGVRTDEDRSAVTPLEKCHGSVVLAAGAEMYKRDAWIRRLIGDKLEDGACQVVIWGDAASTELAGRLAKTSYRLSPAAVAFKKQAVAAATSTDALQIERSEIFYSNSAHLRGSK